MPGEGAEQVFPLSHNAGPVNPWVHQIGATARFGVPMGGGGPKEHCGVETAGLQKQSLPSGHVQARTNEGRNRLASGRP